MTTIFWMYDTSFNHLLSPDGVHGLMKVKMKSCTQAQPKQSAPDVEDWAEGAEEEETIMGRGLHCKYPLSSCSRGYYPYHHRPARTQLPIFHESSVSTILGHFKQSLTGVRRKHPRQLKLEVILAASGSGGGAAERLGSCGRVPPSSWRQKALLLLPLPPGLSSYLLWVSREGDRSMDWCLSAGRVAGCVVCHFFFARFTPRQKAFRLCHGWTSSKYWLVSTCCWIHNLCFFTVWQAVVAHVW